MKKAIFWDFDGTLSYPNKSFSSALQDSLKEFGYDIEKTKEFLNKAYSWKNPQIDYEEKCGKLWWDSLFYKISIFCSENGVLKKDLNKICNRFKELLIAVENYELYDDTADTLNKCVELGYKNYLITNNYPEIIENIEKLGIGKYFTDYLVSSHIGYEKPRKEFFNYAKKMAGNPDIGYII